MNRTAVDLTLLLEEVSERAIRLYDLHQTEYGLTRSVAEKVAVEEAVEYGNRILENDQDR